MCGPPPTVPRLFLLFFYNRFGFFTPRCGVSMQAAAARGRVAAPRGRRAPMAARAGGGAPRQYAEGDPVRLLDETDETGQPGYGTVSRVEHRYNINTKQWVPHYKLDGGRLCHGATAAQPAPRYELPSLSEILALLKFRRSCATIHGGFRPG